jgi:hypothetical protein
MLSHARDVQKGSAAIALAEVAPTAGLNFWGLS